jgi:hypothetical protein
MELGGFAVVLRALLEPALVDGLVEGAFQAGVRAFALVKTLDDVPRLVAFGNLRQRKLIPFTVFSKR